MPRRDPNEGILGRLRDHAVNEGWRSAGDAVNGFLSPYLGEHAGGLAGELTRRHGENAINYIGGLAQQGIASTRLADTSPAITNTAGRYESRPTHEIIRANTRRRDYSQAADLVKKYMDTLNKKKPNPKTTAPTVAPTPVPQSNSPADTQMATDGGEVAVVPPPRKISKIVPDYFTVKLPYYQYFNFSVASANIANANSYAIYLRCNSLYDPIVGTTSNEQPQGRDTWAAMFAYYRVLSSHIRIRWLNKNPSETIARLDSAGVGTNYGDPFNGEYLVGYEMTDSTSATLSNNLTMFMCTKHAKRDLLKAGYTVAAPLTASARTVIGYGEVTSVYNYSPESWDFHVQEQGTEERWTPVKQNPANDHSIALRAFHKGTDNISQKDVSIFCEVYIEYTVQFRETSASLIKTLETSDATYGGAGEDATDTL